MPTVTFTVDSRLLSELGERLVARRSIALSELIKNSYDADATEVTVKLLHVTKRHGFIEIEDNGVGITPNEFQSGWMRIATDEKLRNPRSELYDRPRTGSKGIGRFACHRLARKLQITSIAAIENGSKVRLGASFDWERFRAGEDVGSIGVDLEIASVSNDARTGTKLTLENIREPWNEEDVEQLRQDLVGLVSPFPVRNGGAGKGRKDPGFSVRLVCPEFPKYEGKLEEHFLANAWGILKGRLDSEGRPQYTLKIRAGAMQRFSPSVTYRRLGPAKFQIHYFVYARDQFEGLPVSVSDARRIGRESGGVRVYLDGFRVFAYGAPGDDWLDLDADRGKRLVALPDLIKDKAEGLSRPMLLLPGNNQLFGFVSLSKELNPSVIINMSRERLVENEAYSELEQFVRTGIDWMTVRYARWRIEQRPKRAKIDSTSSTTALDKIVEQIQDSPTIQPGEKRALFASIARARDSFATAEQERIEEISLLQILASAGNMVLIFNHEIRALLDDLRSIVLVLRDLLRRLGKKYSRELKQPIERIDDWSEMVEQQGVQLGLLLGREARLRRRRLAVHEMVGNLDKAFAHYMREEGVQFRNAVKPNLRTGPMFAAELYSILINLLTNALKAVKNQKTARIEVEGVRKGNEVLILFKDTGIGVTRAKREKVFAPFVSTSTPDPVLGAGTGLGLKIVRDIVQRNGGSVRFVDPPSSWKACVKVSLPGGENGS